MRFAPVANVMPMPTSSAVPGAAAPQAPTSDEARLIERMSATRTIEHVRTLNQAPRVWKTAGHAVAVDYVVAQMRAAGWDVHVEELQADGFGGGLLRNVVAERRGTAPDGERKLVIAGAHLNSVRGAPGANDNATGSGTLIELARSLEGIPTRNDVRLVWFDGEEAGLLGSRAHVRANGPDMDRTVAMINMDMVGSQNGTVGFSLGQRTSNAVADALRGVQLRTGLAGTNREERHSRSDHAAFDKAGIPALDFGVGISTLSKEDPFYHSPKDTIDKINPQVLEGYGDLIAVALLEFANRGARP